MGIFLDLKINSLELRNVHTSLIFIHVYLVNANEVQTIKLPTLTELLILS